MPMRQVLNSENGSADDDHGAYKPVLISTGNRTPTTLIAGKINDMCLLSFARDLLLIVESRWLSKSKQIIWFHMLISMTNHDGTMG